MYQSNQLFNLMQVRTKLKLSLLLMRWIMEILRDRKMK